jgi:hypothetical protein
LHDKAKKQSAAAYEYQGFQIFHHVWHVFEKAGRNQATACEHNAIEVPFSPKTMLRHFRE